MNSSLYKHTTHTHVLQIMIYQITDAGLCNATMELWQKGINVTVLVSDRIVSYIDWKRAQVTDSVVVSKFVLQTISVHAVNLLTLMVVEFDRSLSRLAIHSCMMQA